MNSHRYLTIQHNPLVRFCLPVLVIGCLSSCVTTHIDLSEMVRAEAEKKRGPAPESVWNAPGVWQRVADDPPTYIPCGYSKSASRGSGTGTWVVDQRDGKRLFVPHAGVPNFPHAVLQAEAKKVTNWKPRQIVTTVPGIMVM